MTVLSNAPTTSSGLKYNRTFPAWGERINTSSSVLYNKSISDVQFYLGRNSSTTSEKVKCVLANNNGTIEHTFWEMDYNDLPVVDYPNLSLTSETSTPFTGATTVGQSIMTWLDGDSAITSPQINCGKTGAVFDGTDSVFADDYATGSEASDYAFQITVGDPPVPSSGSTVMPPPIAHVRL